LGPNSLSLAQFIWAQIMAQFIVAQLWPEKFGAIELS